MWWSSSSGKIELSISKKDAAIGSHQGDCDMDICYLLRFRPKIRKQIEAIPDSVLASELREFGAWDETELKDRTANERRILWIACGDINEGNAL